MEVNGLKKYPIATSTNSTLQKGRSLALNAAVLALIHDYSHQHHQ